MSEIIKVRQKLKKITIFLRILKTIIFISPLILFVFFITASTYIVSSSGQSDLRGYGESMIEYKSVISESVYQWQGMIMQEMEEQGLSLEFLPLVLAVIMQESRGLPPDVMQSSESIGLPPNTLQPAESIHYGIKHFINVLNYADCTTINDQNRVFIALQSYNFGGGFVNYVNERGGKYTKELAYEFSAYMAKKMGWNDYGDPEYIPHVLRYFKPDNVVPYAYLFQDENNLSLAVQIATEQAGKPYVWGAMGPDAFDCSGLVIYAYKQAGFQILGRPRTIDMYHESNNFKSIPFESASPGDLILYDMDLKGITNHVAILLDKKLVRVGKVLKWQITMFHASTDEAALNEQITQKVYLEDSWWWIRQTKFIRVHDTK